jgi:3',5'-cyclic AMP phosphodiesterase CpdA
MAKKMINRRDFLKLAGLTALGATGACVTSQPTLAPATEEVYDRISPPVQLTSAATPAVQPVDYSQLSGQKKRVLRIAHMTDFHVQPEGNAPDGMIQALRHAQAQEDPPDIILNTGDSIMESLEADMARTEAQWDVYNSLMEAEVKLPVFHAIGNHDVWGWAVSDPAVKNDPRYGKEMSIEKLGLTSRYYSFDRAGWHFVVLDSTHLPNEVSPYPYIGKIDDEQFKWFIEEINAVPQTVPVCIVSHIPILAACEYFDGPNEESGNWMVPAAWMHIDARQFRQLFLKHPNIRLCLSGHTHQYEALEYLGVRYLTNGAVCGNWWMGAYMDFPPAYVMVNLYDDGSADSFFVPYGGLG